MERIGPFEVVRLLGSGGMGRVYLARTAGGERVAVKVVRSELAADPTFRSRFRREVEAASRVPARFTAAVLDADPDARAPWLATAFVEGPSLSEHVTSRGPMSDVRGLALGLLDALVAVHAAGLVHRDLKPSNVLLAADGPRIIDFGIARAADGTRITLTGHIVGTPSYMSPEQAAGTGDVGPAGDVFSLGSLLTFAATGAPPFRAPTTPAVLFRILHDEPDLDDVPDALRGPISRCLAKEPRARPTAADLLAALQGRAAPLTVTPTVATAAPPTPPARRRRRTLLVALAVVAATTTVVGATVVAPAMRPATAQVSPATAQVPTTPAAPPVASAQRPVTTVEGTVELDHTVGRVATTGDRIYVTDVLNSAITVLDAATRAVVATVPVGRYPVSLAPAPDGARVFVVLSAPVTVLALDTATNTVTGTTELGGALDPTRKDSRAEVVVARDAVYVLNTATAEVIVLDPATLRVRGRIPVGPGALGLATAPDGGRLYVTTSDFEGGGTIRVLDPAALSMIDELPAGSDPTDLEVSADGRRIYYAHGAVAGPTGALAADLNSVWVLDAATGEVLTRVGSDDTADRIALDPGGHWLYVTGSGSGMLRVIDTTTEQYVAEVAIGSPVDVAVSPDGLGVAVAGVRPSSVTVLRGP